MPEYDTTPALFEIDCNQKQYGKVPHYPSGSSSYSGATPSREPPNDGPLAARSTGERCAPSNSNPRVAGSLPDRCLDGLARPATLWTGVFTTPIGTLPNTSVRNLTNGMHTQCTPSVQAPLGCMACMCPHAQRHRSLQHAMQLGMPRFPHLKCSCYSVSGSGRVRAQHAYHTHGVRTPTREGETTSHTIVVEGLGAIKSGRLHNAQIGGC